MRPGSGLGVGAVTENGTVAVGSGGMGPTVGVSVSGRIATANGVGISVGSGDVVNAPGVAEAEGGVDFIETDGGLEQAP